jgi:hypothetical protein
MSDGRDLSRVAETLISIALRVLNEQIAEENCDGRDGGVHQSFDG